MKHARAKLRRTTRRQAGKETLYALDALKDAARTLLRTHSENCQAHGVKNSRVDRR